MYDDFQIISANLKYLREKVDIHKSSWLKLPDYLFHISVKWKPVYAG